MPIIHKRAVRALQGCHLYVNICFKNKWKKKKLCLVTLLKWPQTLIFSYLPTALPLMIVIEFMANGSLDNFLKVSLPDFAI